MSHLSLNSLSFDSFSRWSIWISYHLITSPQNLPWSIWIASHLAASPQVHIGPYFSMVQPQLASLPLLTWHQSWSASVPPVHITFTCWLHHSPSPETVFLIPFYVIKNKQAACFWALTNLFFLRGEGGKHITIIVRILYTKKTDVTFLPFQ